MAQLVVHSNAQCQVLVLVPMLTMSVGCFNLQLPLVVVCGPYIIGVINVQDKQDNQSHTTTILILSLILLLLLLLQRGCYDSIVDKVLYCKPPGSNTCVSKKRSIVINIALGYHARTHARTHW